MDNDTNKRIQNLERQVQEFSEWKRNKGIQQISYPLDEVSRTIIDRDISGSFINIGNQSALTIASGSITPTSGYHEVDTESAAATDDLDTIAVTNVVAGDYLIIRAVSSARTVVLKDGTGNLRLASDCTLDHDRDTISLITNGVVWYETARSNNDV